MTAEADGPLYDILVAGMGPVGACAAILAGRAGLRTLVAERSTEVHPLPRAIHFDADIMRIFQSAGLASDLAPLIRPLAGAVHLGADGDFIRDFRVKPERGSLGWCPHYSFFQPELEELLRSRAMDETTVTCQFDVEVISAEQVDNAVSVTVRHNDGHLSIVRSRYVIGCDGASSTIRKCLGIPVRDFDFDEPWIVVDAIAEDPNALPDFTVMWCDPRRPATFVPGPGRHRRWEFMLVGGETPDDPATLPPVGPLLESVAAGHDLEILRSAVYRFHALIATSWRQDRVFLAGDAAHQTPPFFGQGMCHGIRDVNNLIWKLELALRNATCSAVLDTYQAERLPHVQSIIAASIDSGRYICILDPDEAARRDVRWRALAATGSDINSFRAVIPGLSTGVLAGQAGSDTDGQLVPQPDVIRDGRRMRLDEGLGPGFTLLHLDQPPDGQGHAWFTQEIGGSVVGISPTPPAEPETLWDSEGEISRWLYGHRASAAVIRPDRYVFGLACDPAGADALLLQLRDRLTSAKREHDTKESVPWAAPAHS